MENQRKSHNKNLLLVLLIVFHGLAIVTVCSSQELFQVNSFVFCGRVENHLPIPQGGFSGSIEVRQGESLYFWTEIKVLAEGMTMLKSRGELPILHAWGYKGTIITPISIGITKEDWHNNRDLIQWQFSQLGYFTWRTQSQNTCLATGTWYVSVVDANGNPVSTPNSPVAVRPSIQIIQNSGGTDEQNR
jgi:hypothetical protein